ncbi:DUF222 domain-containing protein, partial [Thermopolyspora sp. NPDC052614]|uniref:DUF222 domain-containing protein n=1 Tax=Thermopolyspora sp. NPDC052614 TaxID=3155682 RepID=UPI003429984D
MSPGAGLAVLLERLAGTGAAMGTLKNHELISVMIGWRRLTSWAQAAELEAVAELEARDQARYTRDGVICSSDVSEGVCSEISLALTLTEYSAGVLQGLAYALTHDLPATGALLKSAAIDLPRAKVIVTGLTGLSQAAMRRVEAAVLPHAASMTTGRLRAFVAATVAELAAEEVAAKARAAQKDRRMEVREDEQGTATLLGVNLPLIATVAAANRITALAKAFKNNGDPRTMDQLRADVLLMCMLGLIPGRNTPTPVTDPATPATPGAPAAPPGGAPAPAAPDPSARRPDTPQPDTPQPDGPEPDGSEPSAPRPGVPNSSVPEPATPQSDRPQSDMPRSDMPEPVRPEPSAPHPATPKPGMPEPDGPEPFTPRPRVAHPPAPRPGVPRGAGPEPGGSGSASSAPGTARPDRSVPETALPEAASPEADPSTTSQPEAEVSEAEGSTAAGPDHSRGPHQPALGQESAADREPAPRRPAPEHEPAPDNRSARRDAAARLAARLLCRPRRDAAA